MIISHKYKYIWFRGWKVGGTSVESALVSHAIKTDIVAHGESGRHDVRWGSPYPRPQIIKEKVDKDIWDNYLKIVVIRNPWDVMVSSFWYQTNPSEKYQGILWQAHDRLAY